MTWLSLVQCGIVNLNFSCCGLHLTLLGRLRHLQGPILNHWDSYPPERDAALPADGSAWLLPHSPGWLLPHSPGWLLPHSSGWLLPHSAAWLLSDCPAWFSALGLACLLAPRLACLLAHRLAPCGTLTSQQSPLRAGIPGLVRWLARCLSFF